MSTQWITQARDWIDSSMARLGLNMRPASARETSGTAGYSDITKQPYQNPGKDKNHPGDDAAVESSTEHHKEKPAAL
jgi:hypothetical protein